MTFNEYVERWRSGQFTSFHHIVPWKWMEIWEQNHSNNPDDYPLTTTEGVFNKNAVDAFIRLAPTHYSTDIWPDEELEQVSELAGVCAFITPQAAYEYGHNSLTGNYDAELYVEFEGEELCPAPEDQGVVARVIRPLVGPISAADFRRRHNIQ
jgi:hypothetical protein